ncbi:hypothetical protein [Altericista sp. CCNU0014]|uniref:hypothetical protein n=1 Tax=Altericista sp. CCNU0014 TaxID=3082949 RepID=UPI00384A72E6
MPVKLFLFCIGTGWTVGIGCLSSGAQTISLSEDIPEEVLQLQIEVRANSQLTGLPQDAATYAREQQQLQVAVTDVPPQLSPELKLTVGLLRIRKLLKGIFPFF